jgi:hypothetical protein
MPFNIPEEFNDILNEIQQKNKCVGVVLKLSGDVYRPCPLARMPGKPLCYIHEKGGMISYTTVINLGIRRYREIQNQQYNDAQFNSDRWALIVQHILNGITNMKSQMAELEGELSTLRLKWEENKRALQEAQQLRTDLETTREELKVSRRACQTNGQTNAALNGQMRTLDARLREVQGQLQSITQERDQLQAQIARAKERLSTDQQKYKQELEAITTNRDHLQTMLSVVQMGVTAEERSVVPAVVQDRAVDEVTAVPAAADTKTEDMKFITDVFKEFTSSKDLIRVFAFYFGESVSPRNITIWKTALEKFANLLSGTYNPDVLKEILAKFAVYSHHDWPKIHDAVMIMIGYLGKYKSRIRKENTIMTMDDFDNFLDGVCNRLDVHDDKLLFNATWFLEHADELGGTEIEFPDPELKQDMKEASEDMARSEEREAMLQATLRGKIEGITADNGTTLDAENGAVILRNNNRDIVAQDNEETKKRKK